MSRLAALLMFVAWLLYGAMPAVGMPSMPMQSEAIATPMMQDHSRHHKPSETAEAAKDAHSHDDGRQPCPHGGKICVTPFCAACLTLLPELALGNDGKFAYAYPSPAPARALVSPDPAPLTPPPRD